MIPSDICSYLKRYVSIILVCIGVSPPLFAQTKILNLDNAVQLSIENYPALQQRKAEVLAGQAHINTVRNNRLPGLILDEQLTAGSDNSLQGAYFSLGLIPSTPGSYATVHNNLNAGNTAISFLKWEFFNFGYYGAQQKEANAQLAVSEANLNGEKYLLVQNTVLQYLDWLKKYQLLKIEQENMERASLILNAIRANVISGLKPGVDSSTASAAYSDARLSYLQAQNNYNYSAISIATYTGLNSNDLLPDTTIVTSSAIPPPAVQSSDSVQITHPLLNIYEKQYEQQLSANASISKKYMPKAGLIGAAWVRNSGISNIGAYPADLAAGMPYSRSNYLLGLNVAYNLFDIKHRSDELTEGKYAAAARLNALQGQQMSLNRMIQQANASYGTTIEKLKEIPVQLHSAQEAYGQQMALYRSGLNTLIEVTNAQYTLRQAEVNFINTRNDLLQLLYIRAALSGQSDNFLQNFKQ